MFNNIAGITNNVEAVAKPSSTQLENLLELAKNRIGTRDALQQWINKNVLSMPSICTGKFITIEREYQTVKQDLSDTLWIITMLSIQQQGYTSVALLSAVTKTSINESTGMETTQEDWKESSIWLLNTLVKMGMVESKQQEIDTELGKRTQTIFYICNNWSKSKLNDIIDTLRERTAIVCKPLEVQPKDWKEGETTQEGTKLSLVSRRADTVFDFRASKEALEPLNILQSVCFEVAEGHEADIFNCLDAEEDELKRDSLTELLSLQGKEFYYPVSCDYRFRMYYRGGTVHPQAQKNVRQFLNFANGEIVRREDAIEDLTNALADRENPVQRAELERLLKSNDEYIISKVIVNFDGTANGLQHQSVLLRSKNLAKLTKIVACKLTEEVYQHVTNCIIDAGIKTSRKFIKVVIMTASYGATKNTQMEKLQEKLTPSDALKAYTIINKEIPELKQYTNFVTSRCNQLKSLFSEMNTPDGFQLRFKKVDRTKSTLFAGAFSAIVGTDYDEDKDATARATAPNLIHMLDSYHLRLIVNEWHKMDPLNGQSISTIHDSVGVVAGKGKKLQQVILDTFKQVHSVDHLNNWAKANNVPALNKKGNLELSEIDNIDMFC